MRLSPSRVRSCWVSGFPRSWFARQSPMLKLDLHSISALVDCEAYCRDPRPALREASLPFNVLHANVFVWLLSSIYVTHWRPRACFPLDCKRMGRAVCGVVWRKLSASRRHPVSPLTAVNQGVLRVAPFASNRWRVVPICVDRVAEELFWRRVRFVP